MDGGEKEVGERKMFGREEKREERRGEDKGDADMIFFEKGQGPRSLLYTGRCKASVCEEGYGVIQVGKLQETMATLGLCRWLLAIATRFKNRKSK
jgi:hypothetical protein